MVAASIFRHHDTILYYLIVFVAVMALGALFNYLNSKRKMELK